MNRITASGQQAVNLFIPRYRSELLACNKTIDLSVYIWKKCKYWCNDWQAIKSNFSLPLIRIFFFLIIFKMFHRLFVLIIHCSLDGPSELFCGKWLPWVRYIKCFDWSCWCWSYNDCPLHFFVCFIKNVISHPDLPSTKPKERSGQIRTSCARRSGALIYNKVQI